MVKTVSALVNSAVAVTHDNIFQTHCNKQLDYGNAGSTCSAGDSLDVLDFSVSELESIDNSRKRYNGSSVLVVMEYGDIAFLLETLLDLKAAGSRDVLQIYSAE